MEAEEGNRSLPSGKTSWLLGLICPCLSSCLSSRETKPMRWFQVENGQLQSVPKKKLTKRWKQAKSMKADTSKRTENDTVIKNAQNTPTAIIASKESSKFDWSRRWGPTPGVSDMEKNRDAVSDFLKHLVITARELSEQSSEASLCDSETPPLLRSEGDPYQPYVTMEIANFYGSSLESEDRPERPIEAHEIQDSEKDDLDEGDEQAVNV